MKTKKPTDIEGEKTKALLSILEAIDKHIDKKAEGRYVSAMDFDFLFNDFSHPAVTLNTNVKAIKISFDGHNSTINHESIKDLIKALKLNITHNSKTHAYTNVNWTFKRVNFSKVGDLIPESMFKKCKVKI